MLLVLSGVNVKVEGREARTGGSVLPTRVLATCSCRLHISVMWSKERDTPLTKP